MSRPLYASDKKPRDYTFHPSKLFSLDWNPEEGDCQIFFLSERAATMLRQMVAVFPKYYWVWGIQGPQRDWDTAAWDNWNTIQAFVAEVEASLIMGCDAQAMLTEMKRLNAIIAGETIKDDQGATVHDYTQNGLIPRLNALFSTSEELFYDSRNIAEILSVGLIGRKVDLLPLPWEGTGLADITDDALDKLQDRFVMRDSSLFNPLFGEKNIVEALETLLRLDSVTDIELRPNVASLLSTGDSSSLIGGLKFLIQKWREKLNLSPELSAWLDNKLTTQKHMSTGDLLLLIAHALQELDGDLGDLDVSTTVNLMNNNNCNGSGTVASTEPDVKISLTDDGVSVEGATGLISDGG